MPTHRFPCSISIVLTDQRWRLWNPRDHFQNRLRHSDFERLFARAGLQSVDIKACLAPPEVLASTPLAQRFQRYPSSDLLTEAAYCVLVRA